MSDNFMIFHLYYTAWKEKEFSLFEMRDLLVDEIGKEGLLEAVDEFRKLRLDREATGDFRSYYEIHAAESVPSTRVASL